MESVTYNLYRNGQLMPRLPRQYNGKHQPCLTRDLRACLFQENRVSPQEKNIEPKNLNNVHKNVQKSNKIFTPRLNNVPCTGTLNNVEKNWLSFLF